MKRVKRAGVLGAGVMGATIAAHMANAGLEVVLLDIVPKELTEEEKGKGLTLDSPQVRNRIARQGLDSLYKTQPAPFLQNDYARLIEVGNLEDDLDKLDDCDWVIEVVVENMDIKKKVLPNVAAHLKEGAVLSSNTSGLSINEMATALPPEVRRNFMVTHFFNPPRYMRLMEIVGCNEADPSVVRDMADFLNKRLGKGIVYCKDTPNFVGNRIGVYSIAKSFQHMRDLGMSVEEVDAVAGKPTGRPKTAAFKTIDLVGLDTMAHVAKNSYDNLPHDEEREAFLLPDWVDTMLGSNQLGDKTKQGFYKKEKTEEGVQRYYWDYEASEYKPVQKPKFESIKLARMAQTTGETLKAVIQGEDKAAEFAWRNLRDTLLYAFNRIPEIADDIVNIDNAMKWGFNWELGPFQMFDAMGVDYFVQRAEKDGLQIPDQLKEIECFYKIEGGIKYYLDILHNTFREVPSKPEQIDLDLVKKADGVVEQGENSSILDLGDGVFCLEFHAPQNAISEDMLDMCFRCVERAEQEGVGIVVGNQGERFSVGANLFLLAGAVQEGKWEQLDQIVHKFQQATLALKYCHVPVVAAPFWMALGGGCEFCLNSDAINAYVETYMGLVEMGAGLLPAGGGIKELCVRAVEMEETYGVSSQDLLFKFFLNIGEAKVSQGVDDAFNLGYMRKGDSVTFDIDSLLGDAKKKVLSLATNYRPRHPRPFKAPGRDVAASIKSQLWNMKEGNFITEYEYEMGGIVADALCGGDVDPGTLITEQYLLDLEREGFVRLSKNQKTQERVDHILKTNKPLRN
jgi:3-hydroxyacyl-CoA dehydrogenase